MYRNTVNNTKINHLNVSLEEENELIEAIFVIINPFELSKGLFIMEYAIINFITWAT